MSSLNERYGLLRGTRLRHLRRYGNATENTIIREASYSYTSSPTISLLLLAQ